MIIVGSGPAGLTAAYLAATRGHSVHVIEAGAEFGGMWRGIDLGGLCFERGMQWYCDSGVAEIDDFWRTLLQPSEIVNIPRELAGCEFLGRRQINSPYPDCTGEGGALNALTVNSPSCPILEKVYGTANLAPGKRIVPIDRIVCAPECLMEEVMKDPYVRTKVAWPDQRTLPAKYQSGLASFYPKKGMRHLVSRAVERLTSMGVAFLDRSEVESLTAGPYLWAAGLKSAADKLRVDWRATPARRVSMIATTYSDPDDLDPSPLHYAYSYESGDEVFRTTWYDAVIRGDTRVTAEYIECPMEELRKRTTAIERANENIRVHGIVDLGPCIPVPTVENEACFEMVRRSMKSMGVHPIGAGAAAGAFFQRDWQPHIKTVIEELSK